MQDAYATNTLEYDESKCSGCGMCSTVCPMPCSSNRRGGGAGAPRALHGVRSVQPELPDRRHRGRERCRVRVGPDVRGPAREE